MCVCMKGKDEKGTRSTGRKEARLHERDLGARFGFFALCVHSKAPTGPNAWSLTSFGSLWPAQGLPTLVRCGHVPACPRAAYLNASKKFGRKPTLSAPDTYVPRQGEQRQTPVRRGHRGQSSGKPGALSL